MRRSRSSASSPPSLRFLLQLLSLYTDAACVMELRAASGFTPCGDHEVVICDVVAYRNAEGEEIESAVDDALYTSFLRQQGYMQ